MSRHLGRGLGLEVGIVLREEFPAPVEDSGWDDLHEAKAPVVEAIQTRPAMQFADILEHLHPSSTMRSKSITKTNTAAAGTENTTVRIFFILHQALFRSVRVFPSY